MKKRLLPLILALTVLLGALPQFAVTANASTLDSAEVIAVAQAYADKGSKKFKGLCLKFLWQCFYDAYEINSTACCAQTYGTNYIDSTSRANIPLGADVFFAGSSTTCSSCGNAAGHAALYIGNGEIIHAWGGKIQVSTIDFVVSQGYTYRGWGWHGDVEMAYGYLSKCDSYNSYCTVAAERDTELMTYPCTGDVSADSVSAGKISAGTQLVATELLQNDRGEYWYQVEGGFIPAADTRYLGDCTGDITVSDVKVNAYLNKGNTCTLKGVIESVYNDLVSVSAYVYAGSTPTGEPVTGTSVDVSSNYYSIYKKALDNKCKFGALAVGTYVYCISATYTSCHVDANGELIQSTETVTLYQSQLVVKKSSTSACVVTFDANGGDCVTAKAGLVKGTTLETLPEAQREGYTFVGWYTEPEGGTKVTEETVFPASATVYAHWEEAERVEVSYTDQNGSAWLTETLTPGYTVSSSYPFVEGYYFCGWSDEPGGKEWLFRPGDAVSFDQDTALYPVYISYEQAISGDVVYIYDIRDFAHEGYDIAEVTDEHGLTGYIITVRAEVPAEPEETPDAPADVPDEPEEELPEEEQPPVNTAPVTFGDANGDGWVDAEDGALIMQYEVGLLSDEHIYVAALDLNGDGFIDAEDAAMIMQLEVGLIDNL